MADLKHYIDTIINPTIKDFAAEPRSVRHAFLSCVAVFHAVDYIGYPKKPRNLRKKLRDECPAFKVVDLVAHALKHVETDGRPGRRLHADQVISRPPLAYGILGAYGLSRYGDRVGGVTLNYARTVDVLDAVKKTRDYIRDRYTDKEKP